LYLGELSEIGRKRQEALQEADRQIDKLAHLVLNAGDAGIGVAEIARMANVSRPTVYKLLPRARDKPRDVRLAVLQLTVEGATAGQISKAIEWPLKEVEDLLADFEERGWVKREPEEARSSGHGPVWSLAASGLDAIETWDWLRSMQEYPRC
jgi:DNA-binding IclR family transcriptional regulator